MGKQCSFRNCRKSTCKDSVSLHKFPNSNLLKNAWIEIVTHVNKPFNDRSGKSWTYSQNAFVCSAHFIQSDYDNTYITKRKLGINVTSILKEGALPRIRDIDGVADTEILNSEPHGSFQESHELMNYDHLQSSDSCSLAIKPPTSTREATVTYSVASQSLTTCTTTLSYSGATSSTSVVWDKLRPIAAIQVAKKSVSEVTSGSKHHVVKEKVIESEGAVSTKKKKKRDKLYLTKGMQTVNNKDGKQYNTASQTDAPPADSLCKTPKRKCFTRRPPTTSADLPFFSTPKRLKMNTPNTTFGSPSTINNLTDSTYVPSDEEIDETIESEIYGTSPVDDRKFIVFENSLLSLFIVCLECFSSTNAKVKQVMGSFISIHQECSCGWSRTWGSQPFIGNMPAGNLILSSAIMFSGSVPSKTLRVFEHANIQAISSMTFFNHQRAYLLPAINKLWEKKQHQIIESIKHSGPAVSVGGDGRADSPGHSARYGSYTMIHLDSGKVLDMQLVQSNEVNGSNNMEKEGLIRAVAFLKQENLSIATIVTDRHLQIQKWVRENLSGARHFYDVWHVAKVLQPDGRSVWTRTEGNLCPDCIFHIYLDASAANLGA